MKKTVGIHQPNFFPWAGYFYKILKSDFFVLLDNVDLQIGNAKSITHRTRIKTSQGADWISVPVLKNSPSKKISDVRIDSKQEWQAKILQKIRQNYAKSPNFRDLFSEIESVIMAPTENLGALNAATIRWACGKLEINTPLILASELGLKQEDRNARLVEICQRYGADVYMSGRGARSYHDESVFSSAGIEIRYSDFQERERSQSFPPFVAGLSVIDLMMNLGSEARKEIVPAR